MRKGLTRIKETSRGKVLAQKLYNPLCVSDDFLSVVLFERFNTKRDKTEWVVWNHNSEQDGYFSGGYYTDQSGAWADFNSRGFVN